MFNYQFSMCNVKSKMLKVIFAIAIIFAVCWNVQEVKAQSARFQLEKEIDFSSSGFVYNISGADTLRAAALRIDIPDSYMLYKISLSNTPVLNITGWAGNLPVTLQIDSAQPNMLLQICRYDTTNSNMILSLNSFFNCQTDSNNYKKIYTSFDYDNLISRNYLYFTFVNVHTSFKDVNKIHIIFYFRRFI